jgi:hypothetical protein
MVYKYWIYYTRVVLSSRYAMFISPNLVFQSYIISIDCFMWFFLLVETIIRKKLGAEVSHVLVVHLLYKVSIKAVWVLSGEYRPDALKALMHWGNMIKVMN